MSLRTVVSKSRVLGLSSGQAFRLASSRHSAQCVHSAATTSNSRLARQYTSTSTEFRKKLSNENSSSGNIRVTTVFKALLVLGIGSTAYGLYEFYTALSLWPPEVRSDLRAGIKARNQEDLGLSERYLRRAYKTALELPPSTFAPNSYLKLSGIAITLAAVLEDDGRAREAWDVYVDALTISLEHAPAPASTTTSPSAPERLEVMRQIAIAHKLGEMAEAYQFGDAEEEKWRTYAVEKYMGLLVRSQTGQPEPKTKPDDQNKNKVSNTRQLLADLQLPGWAANEKLAVSGPIAGLAAFYARRGEIDMAMTLYLQSLNTLLPQHPASPASIAERCRAVQIMNNMSSLIMSQPPTPAVLAQAEAWARKSVEVGTKEILSNPSPKTDEDKEGLGECETTLAVALFNLASLREMSGERDEAKVLFERSLEQAKKIGMREGIMEAQVALRRLDRADRLSSTAKTPP